MPATYNHYQKQLKYCDEQIAKVSQSDLNTNEGARASYVVWVGDKMKHHLNYYLSYIHPKGGERKLYDSLFREKTSFFLGRIIKSFYRYRIGLGDIEDLRFQAKQINVIKKWIQDQNPMFVFYANRETLSRIDYTKKSKINELVNKQLAEYKAKEAKKNEQFLAEQREKQQQEQAKYERELKVQNQRDKDALIEASIKAQAQKMFNKQLQNVHTRFTEQISTLVEKRAIEKLNATINQLKNDF